MMTDPYDEVPFPDNEPDWPAEEHVDGYDADVVIPAEWSTPPVEEPPTRVVEFIVNELGVDKELGALLAPKVDSRIAYERMVGLAKRWVRDETLARDADLATIDVTTGSSLLQRERPPRRRVFGDLVLEGHNVTVVARYKVGKSTLCENMVWSATTGNDFLGRFPVVQPQRVAYLNYELDELDMDARIRRLGLDDDALDRLLVINLRGRRLPIMSAAGRRWLVDVLVDHGTNVLIPDPFGAAYASAGGESENDNAEVRRFTTALDEVKRLAGVSTLIMPVHTGRGEHEEGDEHARGATVVDDWPDVQMFLTKDKAGDRFLRTDGRAPYRLNESRLGFDDGPGRLMLATSDLGVSRTKARIAERNAAVLAVVKEQPGLNKRGLRDALSVAGVRRNEDKDEAINGAVSNRQIHTHPGTGSSLLHFFGPSHGEDEECPEGWGS